MSAVNMRTQILREAELLINGDRALAYGPPQQNFLRIAIGWSVILGAEVDEQQVALCMAWLKIARLVQGPSFDGFVDGAGYLALAGELAIT